MSVIRISAADLSYPVLLFHRTGFEVWSDCGAVTPAFTLCRGCREGPSVAIGLLVDSSGQSYRIVDAEDVAWGNGKYRNREQRLAFKNQSAIFICDQGPAAMTVEEVRRRVAWLVSAGGNFESPDGFGLPGGVTCATTIAELLDVLLTNGFGRYG